MGYRSYRQAERAREHKHTFHSITSWAWKRCYCPECPEHTAAHGGTVIKETCKCGAVRYSERRAAPLDGDFGVSVRVTGPWRTGSPAHKDEP